MSFPGNILWLILGGFIAALGWFVTGLLWCITIIGIPVGMQCFKFAGLTLWPFGRDVEYGGGTGSTLINLIWLILGGHRAGAPACRHRPAALPHHPRHPLCQAALQAGQTGSITFGIPHRMDGLRVQQQKGLTQAFQVSSSRQALLRRTLEQGFCHACITGAAMEEQALKKS